MNEARSGLTQRRAIMARRTSGRLFWRVVWFLGLALFPVAPGRSAEPYTFAVVPQFEQRRLFAVWRPIVDEVEKRSGVRLKLVATLTVPEFEKEVSAGTFDFLYANPYHIMRESGGQGYIPLVRDSIPLRGIVVVRKDSPVRGIADLEGKVLAVPSPNAIGASILIRADLERIYHVRVKMLNAKTHSSAYIHVITRKADAGGGVEKTLAEQEPSVRESLRVIYTTREIPSHPVAAHPRVPAAAREKIRRAFLDIGSTPSGQALLADVPMKQVVVTSIDDYLVMRNWGLDSYWVQGSK